MTNYLQHFGLNKPPFATTPDPTFVFASREYEKALLKIAYYTDEKQGLFLLMGAVRAFRVTSAYFAMPPWLMLLLRIERLWMKTS